MTDADMRPQDPPSNTRLLMSALLMACIAFQLNASMLSPALVTMAGQLHTTTATAGLTQTAYFTAAALISAFVPRLSDITGRRRVLLLVLATTTLGELLSAVAPTFPTLFIARVIAGASGAIIPICLLMLRAVVRDNRRYGTLMGVVVAINGGVAGIDTLAGGFLAIHFGFRSVFWAMTLVAALATLATFRWTTESKPSAGTQMDWLGVSTLTIATLSLLLAVDQAGHIGHVPWPLVVGLLVVAIAAAVGFLVVEHKVPAPLVRPAHLRHRGTWALLVTTLLTLCGIFATVNGVVIDFAQNSQVGYGLDAGVVSYLFLTPYALVGWLVGPFAGRLAPRFGYRLLLRIGLAGSIVAIALMAAFGTDSLVMLVAATVLLGVAYAGIANILLSGLAVVLSPTDNPGFLPGINGSAFNLGAALSFATLPVVQAIGSPAGSHTRTGYVNAMVLGLIITISALLTSYLIPRPTSAETPSRKQARSVLPTVI